jgi:hypothetical protein
MSQLSTEATAIRELHVGFPDADLDDLRRPRGGISTRYGSAGRLA